MVHIEFIVFILIAVVSLTKLIFDLLFYWKNDWDFRRKHEGFDLSSGTEGDLTRPVSNKSRALVYYPIICISSLAAAFLIGW